jgi:hypothetical protein
MGKWSTYRRRGTARGADALAPPQLADWALGVQHPDFVVQVWQPFPAGVTGWQYQVQFEEGEWNDGDCFTTHGIWQATGIIDESPGTYRFRLRWVGASPGYPALTDWGPIRQTTVV